jgi:hypothetical protein
VSFNQRTCRLFVFAGKACTGGLLGNKPDLQLVAAQNIPDQQIVSAIVPVRSRGMGGFASFGDDELASLQQAERRNN